MDKRKIAAAFAGGAIGLGGLTMVILLLVFVYSINVWFGIFISALLLMGIGGIILNILCDEGDY